MKVLLINGSPHKNGTTAMLEEQFKKGAIEAGHEVIEFDAAFHSVHPCIACEKCHEGDSGCVFKDDMEELNPHLISADAIIFVSPIYYYDINAQLKQVIDRFYANDDKLHGHKKTALMVALADNQIKSAKGAVTSFENAAEYLEWNVIGTVIAVGCGDAKALKNTSFLQEAYNLGKNMQ